MRVPVPGAQLVSGQAGIPAPSSLPPITCRLDSRGRWQSFVQGRLSLVLGSCIRRMGTNCIEGRGRWGAGEGSEPQPWRWLRELGWLVALDVLLLGEAGNCLHIVASE